MELPALNKELKRFADGNLSRDDVQFWIANQVMAVPETIDERTPVSIASQAANLIGESFCAFQRDDEEARLFALRVLACEEQNPEIETVLDLLPLIKHHEEFSPLVSKRARGVISTSGFRSIVRKRFAFDEVRPWLEKASIGQLTDLMESIEASDFRRARSMLSLPAA